MTKISINPRKPVQHWDAERYVRILLVSFGASVVLTRLFLTLTGFPQIGGGELHIAHLLWGGLLLFVAALLMLIFANHWLYRLSSVLAGVGVGLFIDEVGKFITKSNDYFYPLALPVIYAFFLVTLLIYLRVRRFQVVSEPRAELYQALERIQHILDRQLTAHERSELEAQLERVASQDDAPDDLLTFARVLQQYLETGVLNLAPETLSVWAWLSHRALEFEAKFIGRARLKFIIVAGLGVLGLFDLIDLLRIGVAAVSPEYISKVAQTLLNSGQIKGAAGLNWFFIQLGLEGVVGLLMLISSVLIGVGREKLGTELGYISLLLSLTVVNLLIFYFDQFGNIVLTFIQVGLLLAVLHYRRHYLRLLPSSAQL
jgi:hypothetical protein